MLGSLGLGVLLLMIAFGVLIGLAMLGAGAALRLWALKRNAPPRVHEAIDGNFRVVQKPALPAR